MKEVIASLPDQDLLHDIEPSLSTFNLEKGCELEVRKEFNYDKSYNMVESEIEKSYGG